jgi:hypothetical protein
MGFKDRLFGTVFAEASTPLQPQTPEPGLGDRIHDVLSAAAPTVTPDGRSMGQLPLSKQGRVAFIEPQGPGIVDQTVGRAARGARQTLSAALHETPQGAVYVVPDGKGGQRALNADDYAMIADKDGKPMLVPKSSLPNFRKDATSIVTNTARSEGLGFVARITSIPAHRRANKEANKAKEGAIDAIAFEQDARDYVAGREIARESARQMRLNGTTTYVDALDFEHKVDVPKNPSDPRVQRAQRVNGAKNAATAPIKGAAKATRGVVGWFARRRGNQS